MQAFLGELIFCPPYKCLLNREQHSFPSLANHKVAKARFNQILEYFVHCITLAKERKERKR